MPRLRTSQRPCRRRPGRRTSTIIGAGDPSMTHWALTRRPRKKPSSVRRFSVPSHRWVRDRRRRPARQAIGVHPEFAADDNFRSPVPVQTCCPVYGYIAPIEVGLRVNVRSYGLVLMGSSGCRLPDGTWPQLVGQADSTRCARETGNGWRRAPRRILESITRCRRKDLRNHFGIWKPRVSFVCPAWRPLFLGRLTLVELDVVQNSLRLEHVAHIAQLWRVVASPPARAQSR